jgi:hypothetical protein
LALAFERYDERQTIAETLELTSLDAHFLRCGTSMRGLYGIQNDLFGKIPDGNFTGLSYGTIRDHQENQDGKEGKISFSHF